MQSTSRDSLPNVDVLTANVGELRALLVEKRLTSVDLVNLYLDQIDRHNVKGMELRCVISVAPRESILAKARELDLEREYTGSRGPLHGIPVLVKDAFWTEPSLGMDTTCASVALRGAKPPRNAAVVDLLLNAGMLIIGKSNLSEFGSFMADPPIPAGWSAAGGQTQSPYVRAGVTADATFLGHSTPSGSSSGSAAGVAAGFAPISVGSETDGSIVEPSCRAGLYGLKPSVGTVPNDGAMPVCAAFDSHGGMARTAQDLADITAVLTGGDLADYLFGPPGWGTLSIGFVNFEAWQRSTSIVEANEGFTRKVYAEMEGAKQKIRDAGGRVVDDIPLIQPTDIAREPGCADIDSLIDGSNFKDNYEHFLREYTETPVRSVQEIVDFHEKHVTFPGRSVHPTHTFLSRLATLVPDPSYESKLSQTRQRAQEAIDDALTTHSLDVIVAPPDSNLCTLSSLAGWATGALPLGYADDFNGRAWGLTVIAGGEGAEAKILEVMTAWEKTFPEAVRAPPLLREWQERSGG